MTFWTVLTVFLLFPLLMLTLVFFFRPAWLPLVIPMSTLSALALCWGKFCYFEWRPPLMVLLSMQMLAVTLLVLVLAAENTPLRSLLPGEPHRPAVHCHVRLRPLRVHRAGMARQILSLLSPASGGPSPPVPLRNWDSPIPLGRSETARAEQITGRPNLYPIT